MSSQNCFHVFNAFLQLRTFARVTPPSRSIGQTPRRFAPPPLASASVAASRVMARADLPLVFVICGQSNVAGRGDPFDITTEERARIAAVADRVQVMVPPPVPPIEDPRLSAGVFSLLQRSAAPFMIGPDIFFGLHLAEQWPEQHIVLLKRCMLGTSLNGSWNVQWDQARALESDAPQFVGSVGLYETLLRDLKALGPAQLRGVLWLQGERDVQIGGTAADAYHANLLALIRALRCDTGIPLLPFALVAVSTRDYRERDSPRGKVVRAMEEVSRSEDAVYFVSDGHGDESSADYIPRGQDGTHFDTEGQRRLGVRFAEMMLRACDLVYSDTVSLR